MRARQDILPSERAELLKAPTLTLAETAQVLGVGLTALRDAIRKEDIPLLVLSIGTRKVVPTVAVRRLIGMAPEQQTPALDNDLTEARGSEGIRDGKVVWNR